MKVKVSAEVKDYLSSLAPEPKQRLKHALQRTKPEPLDPPLDGFWKIRSARYRVLCYIEKDVLYALFAAERSTVYEVASASLLEAQTSDRPD